MYRSTGKKMLILFCILLASAGQQEQIRTLQEMFSAVATKGRRLGRFARYPPVPNTPAELLQAALTLEERFLFDYQVMTSSFANSDLAPKAHRLLAIQESQVQRLSQLTILWLRSCVTPACPT